MCDRYREFFLSPIELHGIGMSKKKTVHVLRSESRAARAEILRIKKMKMRIKIDKDEDKER